MRIGELAEQVGTTTRALRHYEELGLLSARRLSNGYRDYGAADIRLVAEIRALLEIGFALEEVRPFVECLRAGNETGDSCPDAVTVYRRKIADLDAYLDRLQDVRTRLTAQLATALTRTAPAGTIPGPGPAGATDTTGGAENPGSAEKPGGAENPEGAENPGGAERRGPTGNSEKAEQIRFRTAGPPGCQLYPPI